MAETFNFDTYQEEAWKLALPSAKTNAYLLPGLAGEVGELLSLFAKQVRDGKNSDPIAIRKELGDILWFVATIAFYNGFSLQDVAGANLAKLQSRKDRGVIGGSGDNR